MLPRPLTKRLVNHACDDDITEGYAADWTVEQLREPAQAIADRIDALMNAAVLTGDAVLGGRAPRAGPTATPPSLLPGMAALLPTGPDLEPAPVLGVRALALLAHGLEAQLPPGLIPLSRPKWQRPVDFDCQFSGRLRALPDLLEWADRSRTGFCDDSDVLSDSANPSKARSLKTSIDTEPPRTRQTAATCVRVKVSTSRLVLWASRRPGQAGLASR